jgi:hypothetical protein
MAVANRVTELRLALSQGGTLRKRVTIISVERERVIEIRGRGHRSEDWCEQCGTKTLMLAPKELAVIAGISSPAVCGLVETGRLHSTRTRDGSLRVCLNSLRVLSDGKLTTGSRIIECEGDRE